MPWRTAEIPYPMPISSHDFQSLSLEANFDVVMNALMPVPTSAIDQDGAVEAGRGFVIEGEAGQRDEGAGTEEGESVVSERKLLSNLVRHLLGRGLAEERTQRRPERVEDRRDLRAGDVRRRPFRQPVWPPSAWHSSP